MLNKVKKIIAVAGLSGTLLGTVGTHAHAATVTVQKGDTLWNLSRLHKTSVENIKKSNHLTTDIIHPGDVLAVGSGGHSTSKKVNTLKHHRVKKGDTLWGIARDHHVSVSQIKKWNKLNRDTIHPGLNLLILDGVNSKNKAVTEKQKKPAGQALKRSAHTVKAKSIKHKSSKKITVKATAYTASCAGCSGTTATGINLKAHPKEKVIAVDPSVIPLGTKVYVEGYGEATAADTGGAIKGNRIDVFTPSETDAIQFGVKKLNVTILS
jgi:3D (Asp-Asp-Asp) domain-containing protein/LysM repeat protein